MAALRARLPGGPGGRPYFGPRPGPLSATHPARVDGDSSAPPASAPASSSASSSTGSGRKHRTHHHKPPASSSKPAGSPGKAAGSPGKNAGNSAPSTDPAANVPRVSVKAAANNGVDANSVCVKLSKNSFNVLGNVADGNNVGAFIATMTPTAGNAATSAANPTNSAAAPTSSAANPTSSAAAGGQNNNGQNNNGQNNNGRKHRTGRR